MSVIAWDGKHIVADKQGTWGNTANTTTKLIQHNSEIIGFTGNLDVGGMMALWYINGADISKWPKSQEKDDWSRLVVASARGVVFYERFPAPIVVEDPFCAWGSGRELALGAMAAGLGAYAAVEIACKYDVNCGCGITSFEIPAIKKEPF